MTRRSGPCIVVTGASGFVGQALCGKLAADGARVKRVWRRGSLRESPTPADILIDEAGPTTNWDELLPGADIVVHLAARVHVMRENAVDSLEMFRRVNVQSTQRLARAAARAGVSRFVFLSTAKVNGDATIKNPFSEEDAPNPLDPYAISKWEAEQALVQVSEETGLGVTILRSPLVYGPGVKGNFLSLLKLLRRGIPLPLASINNRRSLIYVGNLVSAIVACLQDTRAAGQVFMASDGEDLSTSELIRRLAARLGSRARLYPCPPALLRLAGTMFGKTAQITRLTDSLQVDSSKIRRVLDWAPPFSVEQGLAETARWFAANRAAKRC